MTIKMYVDHPPEAAPKDVTAAEGIENDRFPDGPAHPRSPDVAANTDLSEDEVGAIAARLNDPTLPTRIRLLLSRQRIFGTYLTQYVDAFPAAKSAKRNTDRGTKFVLDALNDDELLDDLVARVAAAVPTIPGSPCDVANNAFGDVFVPKIATAISRTRIEAAGDLAFISTVGDGMRVFAARGALVDRWAAGGVEFTNPDVNKFLYCELRDSTDLTETDRRRVQAQVFGPTGAPIPPGTQVNTAFGPAFQQLISALVEFDEERRSHHRANGKPSRVQANLAAEQVRFNLDQAITGVTELQIRELRGEFDRAIFALNHDEVRTQIAGNDNDGIWAVIRRLLPEDGTTDLVSQFEAAKAREAIFNWLEYEPDSDSTGAANAFEEAVEAAVTLKSIESRPYGHPPVSAPKSAPQLTATNGSRAARSTERFTVAAR